MSSSNCCFLPCPPYRRQVRWSGIPISIRIFQFVVIHIVKGFGVVNKAELDDFWNSLALSMIQLILAVWPLVPLPFLNPAWTSRSSWFMYCWNLAWRILSITLLACEMSAIMWQFEHSLALEWKLTFSSPVVTAVFSKFACILNAAVSPIVNKRVWNAVLGYNLRNDTIISFSKASHSVSQ